ncbi:hypothetical protein IFM89_007677 [Coptis chinensis]|uniref:Uncharacterized protein n=1 Tax=Coptis chinensis TaxID=261450 RepID=A0A835LYX7_9MAGN|nr:hypothetical protein IFM89_007677 [Coptis chinensis]
MQYIWYLRSPFAIGESCFYVFTVVNVCGWVGTIFLLEVGAFGSASVSEDQKVNIIVVEVLLKPNMD